MQPPPQPTRARFVLLGLLCGLSFLLYLDRICIAQAAKPIQDELHISNTRWGWVLAAFTLAYSVCELPAGRLGDRHGARGVLTRIVVWWSAFTALTGAVGGFASLLATRFLFGAGEAGAYPNAARVISRWFAAGDRGRVQGVMLAASLLGGAVAPSLAQVCINALGWRRTFVVFGAAGVLWAWAFWRWFRETPGEHPSVNRLERDIIGSPGAGTTRDPIPWRRIFQSTNLLLLVSILACSSFTSYIFFGWFPKYLQEGRGVGADPSSWMASVLLAAGAVGMLAGGRLHDMLHRRGARPARCGLPLLLFAAVALAASTRIEDAWTATLVIALGYLAMNHMMPVWWITTIEVTGRHVGSVFGLLNGAAGLLGAVTSLVLFGRFADWRKAQGFTGRDQFDPFFLIAAGVLCVAALCWWFVDPAKKLEPDGPPTPRAPGIES